MGDSRISRPFPALLPQEVADLIFSYCENESGAYFVSTAWFEVMTRLLAHRIGKNALTLKYGPVGSTVIDSHVHAVFVAAALRIGLYANDWAPYRTLARIRG